MSDYEVPAREVEHGYAVDDYAWGDGVSQLGSAHTDLNWPAPDKDEVARFKAELEERASRRLPFGFRG